MSGSSDTLGVRLAQVLDAWQRAGVHVTPAERALLILTVEGLTLRQIAEVRGRSWETVRTQAKILLLKTGDDTLTGAVIRLLREAASLP